MVYKKSATTPIFPALSSGGSHNFAINTDGELYAWGANDRGQLGDGTSENKNTPTRIGITTENCPSNWVKVAAGYAHSLAINADGELYAWGGNYHGQLGDGKNANKNSPVRIGASTNNTNWSEVIAGGSHADGHCRHCHSLAINTDGELYAWGSNHYGELGDGTNAYEVNPVAVKVQAIEKNDFGPP